MISTLVVIRVEIFSCKRAKNQQGGEGTKWSLNWLASIQTPPDPKSLKGYPDFGSSGGKCRSR